MRFMCHENKMPEYPAPTDKLFLQLEHNTVSTMQLEVSKTQCGYGYNYDWSAIRLSIDVEWQSKAVDRLG